MIIETQSQINFNKDLNENFIIEKIKEIISNDNFGLLKNKAKEKLEKEINLLNKKIDDLIHLNNKSIIAIKKKKQEYEKIKQENEDIKEKIIKQIKI